MLLSTTYDGDHYFIASFFDPEENKDSFVFLEDLFSYSSQQTSCSLSGVMFDAEHRRDRLPTRFILLSLGRSKLFERVAVSLRSTSLPLVKLILIKIT